MIGAEAAPGLTTAGLLFLLAAWGGILAATILCFACLLRTRDGRR